MEELKNLSTDALRKRLQRRMAVAQEMIGRGLFGNAMEPLSDAESYAGELWSRRKELEVRIEYGPEAAATLRRFHEATGQK